MSFGLKRIRKALTKRENSVPANDSLNNIDTYIERKINNMMGGYIEHTVNHMMGMIRGPGHPNTHELWVHLRELNAIKFSVKQEGYRIGRAVYENLLETPIPEKNDNSLVLDWKASTQKDIESEWFRYWCNELKTAPMPHRKLWEFAYILQNFSALGVLKPGASAVGFGCGEEPLPSFFAQRGVSVTVTDLEPSRVQGLGWAETGQHTQGLHSSFHSSLVTKEAFDKHVSLRYVDMNDIPEDMSGTFDLCWSVCALEHLGSIEKGLNFIKNSLKCLKPGGVAIHTTEYSYASLRETIDNWMTVLFLRSHFEELHDELSREGYTVLPMDFDVGDKVLDTFIDVPPYNFEAFLKFRNFKDTTYRPGHLKVSVDGFPATCFAMTIIKN